MGAVMAAHALAYPSHVRFGCCKLADDAAAIHHENAVANRQELVEIGGDYEHSAAFVAHRDERAMDRLDRADVDALRGLFGDDELGRAAQLARELHFLLVAARKRSRERHFVRAAYVELLDERTTSPPRRASDE